MLLKSLSRFAISLLCISSFSITYADDNSGASYADNFFLGDWAGTRTNLASKGYEFEFIYTQDFYNMDYFAGDAATGKQEKRTVYLNNTDITMTIDAEKAWGLGGATFFLYVLGTGGDNPSGSYVGDVQGFNNIESPDAWKLHEAWYQQSFADDQFSMLFGLYDLNSEFDVIETAGLFSGSSHGIGPDFSQSGTNGPSIFPSVSLALRGSYNITDQTYLQGVILDGVPGDPNDPNNRNAKIDLESTDGYLTTLEIGHLSADDAPYHKFSLGFWGYTKATVDDIAAGNDIKNQGAYASADGNIFQESSDPSQGLSAFIRYGFAEDQISEIKTYNGAGLVYTGLFPGRNDDQFGLAIAIANPSNSFKDSNSGIAEAETAIELSYYVQISPWFALKPDVQWIENPGMVNNKADATVIGVRMELSL